MIEGSSSGHCGRASPRSGEGLPILVHSSAGVVTDHPKTVFSDAIRSGDHGEVICVWVGEATNPGPGRESRRRVSSSDEAVLVGVSEVENPGPPRSRSRIPLGSEAVEFDLTRVIRTTDPSSHQQLVPCHHSPHGSTTIATRQRANHQLRL